MGEKTIGRFTGKVALVTGAASGIGAATATAFAREGGAVAIADSNLASLTRLAEALTAEGRQVLMIPTDLADRAAVAAMVDIADHAFGRIDLLHNNGFGLPADLAARRIAPIEDIEDRVWDRSIAVGLTAVMVATRAVLPLMQAQGGGAIVNTASVAGLGGDAGNAAYNSLKAAAINFTRVTAIEQARHGIRANAVAPGFVDTPMLRAGLAGRGFGNGSSLTSVVPAGRFGTADDVAAAVLFLASDAASYIHGVVLPVDGGFTARVGPALASAQ